jgi:hypothetical protein
MNEKDAEAAYEVLVHVMESIVGDGETSQDTLLKAGNHVFGSSFTGVFARDKIPPKVNLAIVNLDESDQPGSHWVALARMPTGQYMVYDSFGRDPTKILPSLQMKLVSTEQDTEQHKREENCGARCLAWLGVCTNCGIQAAKLV